MNSERAGVRIAIVLFFVGCLVCVPAQTVHSQVLIPEGSIIDHAEFSVFAYSNAQGQTVNVYRITTEWAEMGVTWDSFAGSYDPVPIGSFAGVMPPAANTVDVTDLVQNWVDGSYPNYGIFLELGPTTHIRYFSSENDVVAYRPKLEIWFTDPSGATGQVVIQRPAEAQDGVADTYIWEFRPAGNFGYSPFLYTGMYLEGEKQSLIRFFFTVEPPVVGPGTGTQGYWKNHPGAWPVDEIEIGGHVYPKDEAIRIMKRPIKKDMTKAMFRQLVAAKLNILIGNDNSCIQPEVDLADIWLTTYPAESGVRANSAAWTDGEPVHDMLDDYNNGRLPCANHRD